MSSNKMLIDATHPEETRVVVLRTGRVEEFDYESAARKLLRGNIYLAKVTRVEPSLQAAFVDYGGNRHGFLAFNEIHPDYYQIPTADRQALLDEEAAAEAEEEAAVDARAEAMARRRAARASEQPREERNGGRRGPQGRRGERDRDYLKEEEAGDPLAERDQEHDDFAVEGGDAPHAHDDDHEHEQLEPPVEIVQARSAEPHDEDADEEGEAEPAKHPESEQEAAGEPVASGQPATSGHRTVAEGTGYQDDIRSETPEPREESVERSEEPKQALVAEAIEPARSDVADVPKRLGLVEDEGVQDVANGNGEAEQVEQVGSEDALEELPSRPRRRPRSYKIQEVIKRRQIILVQVVKEERGTKGAALTTYLSLAGRYTVLMPNTARGGGISRKITQPQDRKRLKSIAAELEVPEGMGLIIRTAGAARTKQEIKRDFEYLLRLWESVRELTLQSVAPSLVYEEGNLIKRSIRDLYNKDVEEIVVAGHTAHQEAHEFMSMLMPSHAKNVIEYREPEPLFTRYQIERQLNAMFSPYVTLRSGGYLVINQTEALVAIDVNSGKATREFSIEETALNTNLEAAEEIARQLKLRDLAGLIVIDFIDMEERRNNRKVETRLKDALRFDRARIQVGRISHFGLLEMSRQRLRTGVLEGSTSQCPHCQGTGIIRSTESVALAVLRGLEDAIMAGARASLVATTTPAVALYILNNKRAFIIDMEHRTGLPIVVNGSDKMQGANFTIEKGSAPVQPQRRPERTAVNMEWGFEGDADYTEVEETEAEIEVDDAGNEDRDDAGAAEAMDGQGDEGGRRRRRRRRRGRRGDRGEAGEQPREDRVEARQPRDMGQLPDQQPFDDVAMDVGGDEELPEEVGGAGSGSENGDADGQPEVAGEEGDRGRRGRRRGRRGGRRGRDRDRDRPGVAEEERSDEFAASSELAEVSAGAGANRNEQVEAGMGEVAESAIASSSAVTREPNEVEAGRSSTGKELPVVTAESEVQSTPTPAPAIAEAARSEVEASPKEPEAEVTKPNEAGATAEVEAPKRRQRGTPIASEPKLERVVVHADKPDAPVEMAVEQPEPEKSPRRGWWQRRM